MRPSDVTLRSTRRRNTKRGGDALFGSRGLKPFASVTVNVKSPRHTQECRFFLSAFYTLVTSRRESLFDVLLVAGRSERDAKAETHTANTKKKERERSERGVAGSANPQRCISGEILESELRIIAIILNAALRNRGVRA